MQVESDGSALYKAIVTGVAGAAGGVTSTAIWHPLDLLRTRLSAQGYWATNHIGEKYMGLHDAIIKIARHEGLHGMYRGVSAAMLGSGVSWGVYLSCYHFLRPKLGGTGVGNFFSGVGAGVVQVIVTNPIWLVKTRMQLQQDTSAYKAGSSSRYSSVWHGLGTIWKNEGLVGLYRGLAPGLVMTTHGGIQFAVIEECKWVMHEIRSLQNGQLQPPVDIFCASVIGKIIATIITHPMLVVRVRLQDEHNTTTFLLQNKVTYSGLFGSIRIVWRHEGIHGFYKGLLPNLLKAVPLSATAITIADVVSSLILHSKTNR